MQQTAVGFEAFQVQRVVMKASSSGVGDMVPALAESLAVRPTFRLMNSSPHNISVLIVLMMF